MINRITAIIAVLIILPMTCIAAIDQIIHLNMKDKWGVISIACYIISFLLVAIAIYIVCMFGPYFKCFYCKRSISKKEYEILEEGFKENKKDYKVIKCKKCNGIFEMVRK